MLSLAKTIKRGSTRGEPIPTVFKGFDNAGIRLRRGGVCMIFGQPGAGKTQLALAIADGAGVPTLYISNDSDETTVASRLIAKRLRVSTSRVEERLLQDTSWGSKQLQDVDHIKWNFNSSPSLPEVEEEVLAFREVYGEAPVLIVVDILLKMNYAEESEHGTAASIVSYLDTLAREHSACVLLVHHASEAFEGDPCPPRAALLQKVAQLPTLILSVAPMPISGFMAVCAVKNRHGPSDSTGRDAIHLVCDLSMNHFEDLGER
jgi:predicted ATP-dependent serine protease